VSAITGVTAQRTVQSSSDLVGLFMGSEAVEGLSMSNNRGILRNGLSICLRDRGVVYARGCSYNSGRAAYTSR